MATTYVRNATTGEFELVGPGNASTDTTLSQAGKPADAGAVGSALTNYATNVKLANIFSTYYDLDTTVTPGENYSSASGSATLVGNMLRVRLSADRTSPADGNISNETVATFSIAHGGKITGGFAVSIGNGTSGHLANMLVASVACNETALTFKITLTATGGETSSVNPFFAIPVLIDITKF
jgi:hypothetical protein